MTVMSHLRNTQRTKIGHALRGQGSLARARRRSPHKSSKINSGDFLTVKATAKRIFCFSNPISNNWLQMQETIEWE